MFGLDTEKNHAHDWTNTPMMKTSLSLSFSRTTTVLRDDLFDEFSSSKAQHVERNADKSSKRSPAGIMTMKKDAINDEQ
jgi:hypothetical protein